MKIYNVIEHHQPHNWDEVIKVYSYSTLEKALSKLKRQVAQAKRDWFRKDEDGYQYCSELEWEREDTDCYSCCTEREDYYFIWIEKCNVN